MLSLRAIALPPSSLCVCVCEQIAQARSSCVDGTVLHEDLSVCKPLAGKALFDAGKALCEGGSLAPTLIRSGLCDLPGSEDVGWASECPLPLGPLFGLRALNLPLPPRRRTLAAEAPPLSLGSTYSSVGEWPCDHVPPLDSVARAVRQLDATSVMLRWANILLSSAAAQLFYTYCKVGACCLVSGAQERAIGVLCLPVCALF